MSKRELETMAIDLPPNKQPKTDVNQNPSGATGVVPSPGILSLPLPEDRFENMTPQEKRDFFLEFLAGINDGDHPVVIFDAMDGNESEWFLLLSMSDEKYFSGFAYAFVGLLRYLHEYSIEFTKPRIYEHEIGSYQVNEPTLDSQEVSHRLFCSLDNSMRSYISKNENSPKQVLREDTRDILDRYLGEKLFFEEELCALLIDSGLRHLNPFDLPSVGPCVFLPCQSFY
jgi:hypothetical protein